MFFPLFFIYYKFNQNMFTNNHDLLAHIPQTFEVILLTISLSIFLLNDFKILSHLYYYTSPKIDCTLSIFSWNFNLKFYGRNFHIATRSVGKRKGNKCTRSRMRLFCIKKQEVWNHCNINTILSSMWTQAKKKKLNRIKSNQMKGMFNEKISFFIFSLSQFVVCISPSLFLST